MITDEIPDWSESEKNADYTYYKHILILTEFDIQEIDYYRIKTYSHGINCITQAQKYNPKYKCWTLLTSFDRVNRKFWEVITEDEFLLTLIQ
jgi:hypothetical protein